jgi:hypothetical protein
VDSKPGNKIITVFPTKGRINTYKYFRMNITALREELHSLGISTATEGVRGEARYNILQGKIFIK